MQITKYRLRNVGERKETMKEVALDRKKHTNQDTNNTWKKILEKRKKERKKEKKKENILVCACMIDDVHLRRDKKRNVPLGSASILNGQL